LSRKAPFVLPVHPDPCPELEVELGPDNKGVGWWVPQVKHTYLAKYIDATRKAQIKFSQRVFIDPFCAPGRIQVTGESFTRDGGALVAWRQSVASACPFTSVLVGDLNAGRAQACATRLAAIGAPVTRFEGPAVTTTLQMIEQVPPRALCLAYIDPYNLEYLSFSIIEELAKLRFVDFAVHFSLMDLTRNVDMELNPDRDRFAGASPGWRDRVPPKISKARLPAWFFEDWMALISGLGFQVSQVMPLVEDGKGRALYRLVFFSRHAFPDRIWGDIAKNPTRDLFV
jgi:three-Cys-motif partner protein